MANSYRRFARHTTYIASEDLKALADIAKREHIPAAQALRNVLATGLRVWEVAAEHTDAGVPR